MATSKKAGKVSKPKRNHRNYRILDEQYFKAMERADKDRHQLSNLIEDVVIAYSNGAPLVKFLKENEKHIK